MKESSVSICLPTYEPNPQLLRQTIESVLRQTFADWTMLIHDDASEEDVLAIVEPFLKDPRITFARSDTRHGIGGNWNETFKKTKSDASFTAYIFQDDHWEPSYLQHVIAAFDQNRSAGMVAVMHHYQIDRLHPLSHQFQAIESERRHLFLTPCMSGKEFLKKWLKQGLHPNLIGEPSFVVVKTEILQTAPWDLRMVQCLDVEGWTRMLPLTDIAFVGEDLGTFIVHDAGASASHQKKWRGLLDRLIVLLRLCKNQDGSIRKEAMKAVFRELPKMAAKFFRRLAA